MLKKIILYSLCGLFFIGTPALYAREVTTLCRFVDPESGHPVLGAVMENDEILPLQAVYSSLNNGENSKLLESLESFFMDGGTEGKALAKLLATHAEKNQYPLLNSKNVQLLTPLESKKLIAGSIFEGHATRARESWARELMPVQWAIAKMIGGGPFSPPAEHYKEVTYYQGNHLDWFSHRTDVQLPEGWESIDFEVEIGMLVVKAGNTHKVGGYFLFNDLTHRKTQGVEIDKVKHGFSVSKHLNAAGWKLVFPEYVDFSKISVTAEVIHPDKTVENLCTGKTQDALFSPEEVLISIARRDGGLCHGEVISTGTLSGCCGLEIRGASEADLLQPGDTIRFESELLGSLENSIAGQRK